MAVRKRFNKDEREFIRAALENGCRVEWRNGSHWHPATVRVDVHRDDYGWDRVILVNHGNTKTVSDGEIIHGRPGAVRPLQS